MSRHESLVITKLRLELERRDAEVKFLQSELSKTAKLTRTIMTRGAVLHTALKKLNETSTAVDDILLPDAVTYHNTVVAWREARADAVYALLPGDYSIGLSGGKAGSN